MQSLKLQVIWLEDSLGLAINQVTSKGNLPITPYFFWPVGEAWEQIRFELDSKIWIDNTERIKLLNLIVEVMNYWQEAKNDNLFEEFSRLEFEHDHKIIFPNVDFIGTS